jgi:high-affinity K+ transport system ATPase subunit B
MNAIPNRLTTSLRSLQPAQATRRPAVFMLEITAALTSVIALRDAIAGGAEVSIETLVAFALWGTLLAVAVRRTIR